MRHRLLLLLALVIGLGVPPIAALAQTSKGLNIYVVDVEGGNATLFVAPSGESVLIDTGNGGPAAVRDADRIMAAVKDAGVVQIDHLITTHWHGDHFGAMAELARPHSDQAFHRPRRQRAAAGRRRRIPAEGLSRAVREGDAHRRQARRQDCDRRARLAHRRRRRAAHKTPLPGAGKPNPYCATYQAAGSRSERERAVGRQHRHVRQVSRRASRRPDVEQGIRADVPEQPRSARWISSSCRITGRRSRTRRSARARAAPARGDHEQRHAQGRPARRDEGAPLARRASRTCGRCTSRC